VPAKKETIVERFILMIDEIMGAQQLSQNEFAATIASLSSSGISHLRKGRLTMIGADVVAEVCQKYHYSAEWVLFGKGDRKKDKSTQAIAKDISDIKELIGELVVPLVKELMTKRDVKTVSKLLTDIENKLN